MAEGAQGVCSSVPILASTYAAPAAQDLAVHRWTKEELEVRVASCAA